MESKIYELLSSIGYHHPLHPAMTHLPVGLTISAFLFAVLAFLLKRSQFGQTAVHCIVLAFLTAIPTIVSGYFDWQHFYGGGFIVPIVGKMVLATLLLVLLCILSVKGIKNPKITSRRIMAHFAGFVIVIGLGFFGGELVYTKQAASSGKISPDKTMDTAVVKEGERLFEAKCSFCHFTESAETKVGPGLKGLFQREKMPVSGWPVSGENLERQLKTPFDQMPAFDELTSKEINSLENFLKTL